jgi:hypothetical protein
MDRVGIRVRIVEVQYLLHHHHRLLLPTILPVEARVATTAELVMAEAQLVMGVESVTGLNVNLIPLSIRGIISVATMGQEVGSKLTISITFMGTEDQVFL